MLPTYNCQNRSSILMDSDYISPYLFNLPKEEEDNPLDLDWSSLLQDQDQTTCPYNGTNNIMTQSNQYFANFSQPQHNIFSNYELMLSDQHSYLIDFYSTLDHFEFSTPTPTPLLEVGNTSNYYQEMEEETKASSCHANSATTTNFMQNGDGITYNGVRENSSNNYKRRSCCNLEYEDIQKYFDVPISRAAKELKVGLTVLKRRCRELNIMRWPHRKIKSLDSLIKNVQEMGLTEELARLEQHKQLLALLPDMELTERTKKLRQACFKANYKKRIKRL